MTEIPVYSFTGFLDSGKTTFIQETLEDPRFNAGERTLLLALEEGEVEYDLTKFKEGNIILECPEDIASVTTEYMAQLQKQHNIQRVVLEMNGMQQINDFYNLLPEGWIIAQEVTFADSSTFMQYNQNMRSLVVDKLKGAEMVVFNRVPLGSDTMPLHKLARAVNRRIDIVYEYTDRSTVFDEREDPLPFDLNAPVIKIEDDDYALFYRDINEEPKKYDKKTVCFKGQVARLKREKDGIFAPGRFVMTCCEADITFMGIPCKYPAAASLPARGWVMVTARVSIKHHSLYRGGAGPILTAITVDSAEAPENEVATF